ncbi:MAG TPA: hypothetical protein VF950_08945 [Planctomycetota bacterium]
MTTYRRPKVYIPPYNYCDRWCERCRIDKSRCLLYQTEADERLHREIDGRGEPSPDEIVKRMSVDVEQAIRLVQEQAKEMGLDLETAMKSAPPPPPPPEPAIRDGAAIARATMAFTREHGKDFPGEAEILRRMPMLVGPKLGRAMSQDAGDEVSAADAILQAQIAHRALGEILAAFDSIGRKRPGSLDAYLELLSLIGRVRKDIEETWFSRPNALLEPCEGDTWWGPLRDVTLTLKNLRR